MTTRRPVGLAPLSILGTPPPDVVDIAADAGFDFVGLRLQPVTDTEPAFPLSPGSALLAETRRRLEARGITLWDTEFLALDGTDQRERWLPMLEAAGELGARSFTVASRDEDESRCTDVLGRIVTDAAQHDIVVTLEPISYNAVSTIAQAARIARAAGAKVLLDTLHLGRADQGPEVLADAADVIAMVQLCDGPVPGPTTLDERITESRSLRLLPGAGGLGVEAALAAAPADLPVSVECPDLERVAAIGPLAWARELRAAAATVLEEL